MQNSKSIVYNLEPKGYSSKAIGIWKKNNYKYVSGSLSELINYENINNINVLIVRLKHFIDSKIIDNLTSLKYILTATTGTVHLDKTVINSNNIKVYSLKNEKNFLKEITSTPELTWGLIISLFRNIHQSYNDVINGNWNRDRFFGNQLSNKTIGLIGLGRVGSQVAEYAQAFKMNVSYYDPYVNSKKYKKLNNLVDLFKTSDIISVHVHVDQSTTKMINIDLLRRCKSSTVLINTSRGEIWNENDIVQCLEQNIISGIATDVISEETKLLHSSPIWKKRKDLNILITPHIGGASYDALEQCELKVQSNLINDLK